MAAYMREYSASSGRENPPQLSVRANLSFGGSAAAEGRLPLQGTAEDIIADLQEFADTGVSHVIMEIPGDSFAEKFKAMERFMEEVKPNVPA